MLKMYLLVMLLNLRRKSIHDILTKTIGMDEQPGGFLSLPPDCFPLPA